MQLIKLYDWNDTGCEHCLKEVEVLQTEDLSRNGTERMLVWARDPDEYNYLLYPADGTAYPEFDNQVQMQRHARRYRYEAVS